jgi:hypothetical protein
MVSYFLIMNVYCARGPGSAKAYHRIAAAVKETVLHVFSSALV